ncbi:MAG: outer membrane lipoprotein-sorting protein [Akkermansia sp.]
MNTFMSHCRRVLLIACLSSFVGIGFCANSTPRADDLLKNVRQCAMMQDNKNVAGQLRKQGNKVPFNINLRENLICFQYQTGGQWQRFDLRFKDKGQEIQVMKDGALQRLPVSQYAQPIAGTDVTFEDLSMRFLYWSNGSVMPQDGSSEVKGRDCWVVQVKNPTPNMGQYEWARVWIDKENGAMWQIDGIAANGELSKRFIMDSVMKLKDGTWFFKKMKLEVRDPSNSRKTRSVSYIEMNSPE